MGLQAGVTGLSPEVGPPGRLPPHSGCSFAAPGNRNGPRRRSGIGAALDRIRGAVSSLVPVGAKHAALIADRASLTAGNPLPDRNRFIATPLT